MSKFIVLMVYVLAAQGPAEHRLTIVAPPYVTDRYKCFDFAEKVARQYERTQAGHFIVKEQQCLELR